MLKIGLFAHGDIGLEIAKLFRGNKNLLALALDDNDELKDKIFDLKLTNNIFNSNELSCANNLTKLKNLELDLIILAWWPYIIKGELLEIAKIGLLNFHPSLLPYNRGKHYYFWNIIEQVPFGVTLHLIDENIDKGKVLFQKKLDVSWVDNGNSLRERSKIAMLELFKENFENILNGRFSEIKIDWSLGNIHYGKEIQDASKLDLNKTVLTKDLLNLLRARSGFANGGVWFEDEEKKYEVSITIKEI